MKNYLLSTLLILLFFSTLTFAQNTELQVGSNFNQLRQNQGAFYDYSDPSTLNIKVSVWGFVKYPGKYVIPIESTIYDLLSYAGGPTQDAHLDDLRIFRTAEDSAKSMLKFNYNDLLWDENLREFKNAPALEAGDILLVPGSQRLYFKDYLQIGLSVFSALISLSILILNIAK
ncbi:MAG TPA: SLBB domain-containing protein [Ignavibacteriaceae bacterium]|nr:SLBB domain-containing protein [Ignavibacteriaceae bacterium]